MIRHHAIGKHPTPRKPLIHPHQDPELLLFLCLEKKLPMNHPGRRVVDGQIRQSPIGRVRNDQSRLRHTKNLEELKQRSQDGFFQLLREILRDLNGVGIGGSSSVLLGFISLTENLMMIGASVWMVWKSLKSAGRITPTSEKK